MLTVVSILRSTRLPFFLGFLLFLLYLVLLILFVFLGFLLLAFIFLLFPAFFDRESRIALTGLILSAGFAFLESFGGAGFASSLGEKSTLFEPAGPFPDHARRCVGNGGSGRDQTDEELFLIFHGHSGPVRGEPFEGVGRQGG
ncbi:MAG TPA: hypothetical protein VM557_12255 [Thermoanaerobaculia bacterium]|nr:hypothetical protein [Thermoanaerobaculia bacterium]